MTNKFAIRLAVEGARQAGQELQSVPVAAAAGLKTYGDTADRAGAKTRAFRQETSNATPALRALDAAVKDARSEMESFGNRIPIIGPALSAIGPAGLAAAAGVVAIGAGLASMLRLSQQAIDQLGKLKDSADNVALGVEDFQAFRGAALLEGIDPQAAESMLQTLAINSARASEGFGKMYAALQRVNPELAEQLALSTSQAQRLDILARAIQGAVTYNDKLNIAVAAFGSEGAQMIRVLDESGASMETWRARAQAAGLVIEEDLVNKVDAIGKRMDALAAQSEVAGQRLGVAFAPTSEAIARTQTNVMLGVTQILETYQAVEDRSSWMLATQLNRRQEHINTILYDTQWASKLLAMNALRELDAIEAELKARIARVKANRDWEAGRIAENQFWQGVGDGFAAQDFVKPPEPETAEQKKKREDDERRAADDARIRAGYEREAIQIRAELGDITGLLAVRQKELNALVAAGVGITREMAEEAMRRYREELDGTAAAQARINAILDDAKTPLERINDEISSLTAAWEASGRTLDGYGAALAALKTKQQDIIAGMEQSTTAANDNVVAWGELPDVIGRTSDRLGEVRRRSLEVEFGMAGIVGILDQQIETWEDAGAVGLRVLRDIAVQAMMTAAQMQNANLGSILAAGFGVFMGGWGGASASVSPAAHSDYHNWQGSVLGSYMHGGGVPGDAGAAVHMFPAKLFNNAPRYHSGLAPDEFPAILQQKERVLSADHNERFVTAIESVAFANDNGRFAGGVKVNIHNYAGGEVETQERRGPGGEQELDVFIGRKINAHIASGGADGAMAQRYSLQRAVGSR